MLFARTTLLAVVLAFAIPASAQKDDALITVERGVCFGSCPAYLLQIDSSGAVSFRQGPPGNRHIEQTSKITPDQFNDLITDLLSIRFFERPDAYPPTHTDGQTTSLELILNGKRKTITHSDDGPAELDTVEHTIERVANIHRWLHGDPRRLTLQSPVAGPQMGSGDDLKNEMVVGYDAWNRLKPGMTLLMQAARKGDVDEVRRLLQAGEDVNAVDETGWTALMIAAVKVQPEAVSALLDGGARVNQQDRHGDTALIGSAAVRFGNIHVAAEVMRRLLSNGASVETTNDLGESALMWAARSGNTESIDLLLKAGADPSHRDQSGHDALSVGRSARDGLSFDPALVERYDQAIRVLQRR
jgi:Ankyrin repeats (3 copies)/Domain of unknown function (DUF6438)/Ankyrin repeats (many copies)